MLILFDKEMIIYENKNETENEKLNSYISRKRKEILQLYL